MSGERFFNHSPRSGLWNRIKVIRATHKCMLMRYGCSSKNEAILALIVGLRTKIKPTRSGQVLAT